MAQMVEHCTVITEFIGTTYTTVQYIDSDLFGENSLMLTVNELKSRLCDFFFIRQVELNPKQAYLLLAITIV